MLSSLAILGSASAQPAKTWLVLPFEVRGVDPQAVAVFTGLLQTELTQRLSARIVGAPTSQPCLDASCAVQVGRQANVQFVAWGSVSALGTKIIVNITVADTTRHAVISVQKMAVTKIEELDAVATRIVTAVAQGTTADKTAELGTITENEVQPDKRREGARGTSLRVGAIIPLGKGFAANPGGGVLFDLGYWFETRDFAIEPRIGVRFDGVSGEAEYGEVPIDVGVFYLLSRGDVAPFVGIGLGVRYMWETKPEEITVGAVLPSTAEVILEDSVWGFGTYARVGLMLLRTYALRMALSAEYNLTVATINGFKNPQSVTMGASLIF